MSDQPIPTPSTQDESGLADPLKVIGEPGIAVLQHMREVQSRNRPQPGERLVWVHIVHGTWANPEGKKIRPTWWEPGGSFERALRALQEAEQWKNVRFAKVPSWSGKNSFAARGQAIEILQKYFHDVLFDPKKTFDRHVVIAHSHGGTVAAEALRNLGPLAGEFSGLLTLGTPFLHRVQNDGAFEASFDSLTGLYAPVVAAFFAISLSFVYGIHTRFWLAGLAFIWAWIPELLSRTRKLSLVGWALSAITPLVVVAVCWKNSFNWIELLSGSMCSALFTFFVGSKMLRTRLNPRLYVGDLSSLDELPLAINTDVLAIRAPGDEASLAISAATSAIFLNNSLREISVKTFARIPKAIRYSISPLMLLSLVCFIATMLAPNVWIGFRLVGAGFPLIFVAAFGVLLAFLTLFIVLKFLVVAITALACGWEAFEAPGLIGIFAEPLPRCAHSLTSKMTLRMVFPTRNDLRVLRQQVLRHSLYEYPSVQEYVASWILSFTDTKSREQEED